MLHFNCVKSVQIRSFFQSVFSYIRNSVYIQENTDQKKTLYLDTFGSVFITIEYNNKRHTEANYIKYSELKVSKKMSKKFSYLLENLQICNVQKQPFRDVLGKRCSENMQQIYKRTPMPKCQSNFIEIALRHEYSSVNLLHIFRTPFPKNIYGWLLLQCFNCRFHGYHNI